MFLDGLDEIDQKILDILIHDARTSYSKIGEIVKLSRVAVKLRIQALEEKGIIEEYTTIINPQKISGAISAYFEIEIAPLHYSEVVEQLYRHPLVTQIYRVTGKNRLHVHIVAPQQEVLESFIKDTIDQLPGVLDLSYQIILSRIKDIKGLRL